MIKEGSDFFQNAKFCPILIIHRIMNSKFDAILQPVLHASYVLRNGISRLNFDKIASGSWGYATEKTI